MRQLLSYNAAMADTPPYGIGDLAELAGVSRRTVRYYVQEGLMPPPLGVGRGNHYARKHLDQLLRVKALQEAGRTLEDIRRILDGGTTAQLRREAATSLSPVARTLWRRLTLAPGVELHVSSDIRLPSAGRLTELANWCRQHMPATAEKDENHDA
jgi:DNA-binding transcriptional MerR regulator